MIPDGTNLTYTGTWSTTAFKTSDTVIKAVNAGIARSGLIVRSYTADAGWLTKLGVSGPFTITLHLQIENGMGFDSEDDVISIIRHWVYDTIGDYPTADSIPYKRLPGNTKDTPTGQPAPPPAADAKGCIAGTSNNVDGNFSLSCWFGNLTTKGLSSVGFVAILAILGVGLLVFARPAAVAS